ncbi:MAG: 50S ribosomal protein L29 [Gammaproteobacteria bacterium RIFOXYB2_FULL_38_6]|nr:MAG: 50S ribosomal protein L29 [Gammaproteobacteria bacterium RIFOXYB2_FULL_38_6]
MKSAELRKKSVSELQQNLLDLLKQQFKLRMQKGTEQMAKTHVFAQVRHDIARIKTILREKELNHE